LTNNSDTNQTANSNNNSDTKPQTKPNADAPKVELVHLTEGFESGNIKGNDSDD